MSALGQKQTSAHIRIMSVSPPKADVDRARWNVRYVPQSDSAFADRGGSPLNPIDFPE